jgi:DNA-binding transcriptional ArsR family regulator
MRKLPCARYLQALADDTRIRIAQLLLQGERCVTEIAEAIGEDVGRVSYHLGILRSSGVVEEERRGRFIYYALGDAINSAVGADGMSLEFGCCTLRFTDRELGV